MDMLLKEEVFSPFQSGEIGIIRDYRRDDGFIIREFVARNEKRPRNMLVIKDPRHKVIIKDFELKKVNTIKGD